MSIRRSLLGLGNSRYVAEAAVFAAVGAAGYAEEPAALAASFDLLSARTAECHRKKEETGKEYQGDQRD
jgi:hypothetical protein